MSLRFNVVRWTTIDRYDFLHLDPSVTHRETKPPPMEGKTLSHFRWRSHGNFGEGNGLTPQWLLGASAKRRYGPQQANGNENGPWSNNQGPLRGARFGRYVIPRRNPSTPWIHRARQSLLDTESGT